MDDNFTGPVHPSLDALRAVLVKLRSPEGCPWDQKQKKEDIRRYLLEEAYEAADAVAGGDPGAAREELGDLLFQILFLVRIYEEAGSFTFEDVLREITEKMVRRHPHVFGNTSVDSVEEVRQNWQAIKTGEKKGLKAGFFDGIPHAMPALRRAGAVQERAAAVGFDWKVAADVLPKVREELGELESAVVTGSPGDVREELGDLLFALVNLSRFLSVDGEEALQAATDKFIGRFLKIEGAVNARGGTLSAVSLEEMDALWNRFKTEERKS